MAYDIKEPDIWFSQTIEERNSTGAPRLRLLPGQYIKDGAGTFSSAHDDYNVQSPLTPRQDNKIGTIFFSKDIVVKKTVSETEYYMVSSIAAIDRGVTTDIAAAFRDYQKITGFGGGTAMPVAEEEETGPPVEKVKTTLEKLLERFPCPTVDKDNFYVREDLWSALLFNIHQGYNTMLLGESGTGKTELTQIAAKLMSREISIFDMGAKQDPIASLVGVHRFDGAKSIFDRADFTYKIEKAGIVVLDELPRAPMNTNNILFPVLDSRRELQMDIASTGESRSIKVHDECRFIATANEGFKYTGSNVMDLALKERFHLLIIEFMPNEMEVKLLMKRTGCLKKASETIVKVAQQIRVLAAKDEVGTAVSVRHTLYAADLHAGGFKLPDALEIAVLPLYTEEEERKKIKDLLSAR